MRQHALTKILFSSHATSILLLGIPGLLVSWVVAAAEVYGISEMRFTEAAPGYPPGSHMIDKCVLYQVGKPAYRDKDEASKIVEALSGLTSYRVLDKTGRVLDIRLGSFQLLMDDYPRYYAGSAKPTTGCGNVLISQDLASQVKETPRLADQDYFENLFREQERQLYVSALKSSVRSRLSDAERKQFNRANADVAFDKSDKSPVDIFHDGREWYFARSYSVEFFTPIPIRMLLLSKVDERVKKLESQAIFLNTKIGEAARTKTFAGVLDIDGDRQKEIIIRESGVDGISFTFSRKRGDHWE